MGNLVVPVGGSIGTGKRVLMAYIDQNKLFIQGEGDMASGFPEDDRPLRKIAHEVGQDLSTLSIEELSERIVLLEGEIERLKTARSRKSASKQAADAFFKL